jgi:hypothetical protein
MPLQIGGECNARHAAMLARVEFAAKYQYASDGNQLLPPPAARDS